jgi:hypothetical protein
MEFSFEVNPDLDLAIGMELSPDDAAETTYEMEDFDYSEYDPLSPTGAKPGSEDKVKMLAARYAAGVPLWHDSDCYDHGPESALSNEFGHDDLEDDDF